MKTQVVLLLAVSGWLGFSSLPAQAEIYQCDGKWTNLPCEGSIQKTLPESASVSRSAGDAGESPVEEQDAPSADKNEDETVKQEPLAPRYSLVRRLRKFSRDFFLAHKIGLTKEELRDYEERCMKRETPLDKCQGDYDSFIQRLKSQVKKP